MAAHQTLLSELIRGLKQPDVQTEALFTDRRWRLVRSFAPRQSWLAVLEKNGFPAAGCPLLVRIRLPGCRLPPPRSQNGCPLLVRIRVMDRDISRLGFPRPVQQADLQPA